MPKVLVVDDIGANRKLLGKILAEIKDYEVVEAGNGKEAITRFSQEAPDLILMDVNMPEMNGYQSAAEIKKKAGNNYIPIIFITALPAEASLANALSSGGDDFISKPFDFEVLESKINVHLRIRELNQQLNKKNKQLARVNQNLRYEKELIEHFFDHALKRSFLDKSIIKYHMSSMSTFNGDLLLVERGPQGGLYLIIGDFTGHGLTAAMGTLPVASIFFKMANNGDSVGEIAREINRQLYELMPPSIFFAATLLELNARGNSMSVWMGGMPECYWLGHGGEIKATVHSRHMPLGILQNNEFDEAVENYPVEANDKFYLFSDGLTEAKSANGEMFGDGHLKHILGAHGRDRFERVLAELKIFAGENNQNDDVTLVEVSCHEIPAEEREYEADAEGQCLPLPWRMSVALSPKEMREQDPVSEISDMLSALPPLGRHKRTLHILLSEMYSNALEHSILNLDSAWKINDEQFVNYYRVRAERLHALEDESVIFDIKFSPASGRLNIRVNDSGKGYVRRAENDASEQLYGRGLEIINGLCEKVLFSDDGKTLDVTFNCGASC